MTCHYFSFSLFFAVCRRLFFVSRNSFQLLTRADLKSSVGNGTCDVTKGADTLYVFYLSKWKVQKHICFTVSKPVCLRTRL